RIAPMRTLHERRRRAVRRTQSEAGGSRRDHRHSKRNNDGSLHGPSVTVLAGARRGALRQRPSWSEGLKRVCPTRLITASEQSYVRSGAAAQQENKKQDRDRHAQQPQQDVAGLALLRGWQRR